MRVGREEAGQLWGRRLGTWKVCIRIPGSTRGTPKVKAWQALICGLPLPRLQHGFL